MFKYLRAGLLVLIALMAFSCDLFQDAVSIESRIQSFEDDLNAGNYDNLYKHLHPESPSYDSFVAGSILSSGPLAYTNNPFSFGSPTVVSSAATGTFTSSGTGASGLPYTFIMREDDGDWKIYTLDIGGELIIKRLK